MKKVLLIITVLTFLLCLAACNKNVPNINKNVVQIQPQKQEEITLYFPNKAYVDTGNESIETVLPEKRMVNLDGKLKEQVIVEELLKGPINSNLISLSNKLKLIDVKVKDGVAYVNFKGEGLSGGSLEEEIAIDAIVKSLTEDKTISKVQFLVDGKVVESLMGHIDTTAPLARE